MTNTPPSWITSNNPTHFNLYKYMGVDLPTQPYETVKIYYDTLKIPRKMFELIEADFIHSTQSYSPNRIDVTTTADKDLDVNHDPVLLQKWAALALYFIPGLLDTTMGIEIGYRNYDEMVEAYYVTGNFGYLDNSPASIIFIQHLKRKIIAYLFNVVFGEKRANHKPPFSYDIFRLYYQIEKIQKRIKHQHWIDPNTIQDDYENYVTKHIARNTTTGDFAYFDFFKDFRFLLEQTGKVLYLYFYFRETYNIRVRNQRVSSKITNWLSDTFINSDADAYFRDFTLFQDPTKLSDEMQEEIFINAMHSLGLLDSQNGGELFIPKSNECINPFYWIFLVNGNDNSSTNSIPLKLYALWLRYKIAETNGPIRNCYGDVLYNLGTERNIMGVEEVEFKNYNFNRSVLLEFRPGKVNTIGHTTKIFFHQFYKALYYYHENYAFFSKREEIDDFLPDFINSLTRTNEWPITLNDYFEIKKQFENTTTFISLPGLWTTDSSNYDTLYNFCFPEHSSLEYIIPRPSQSKREGFNRIISGKPEMKPPDIPNTSVLGPGEHVPPVIKDKDKDAAKKDEEKKNKTINIELNHGSMIIIGLAAATVLIIGNKRRKVI